MCMQNTSSYTTMKLLLLLNLPLSEPESFRFIHYSAMNVCASCMIEMVRCNKMHRQAIQWHELDAFDLNSIGNSELI